MASNNEQYRFQVEAQTEKAMAKLEQLHRLMQQIERIRVKGEDNYNTTTQKDVDKGMRNISKITKEYQNVLKDLGQADSMLKSTMADLEARINEMSKGSSSSSKEAQEQIKQLKAQQAVMAESKKGINDQVAQFKRLRAEAKKTMEEITGFRQTHSKAFTNVSRTIEVFDNIVYKGSAEGRADPYDPKRKGIDRQDARRMVDEALDSGDSAFDIINNIKNKTKEVDRLRDRSRNQARRAVASDYMSYQQYSNFQKDYSTSQHEYLRDREENRQSIADLGLERDTLMQEVRKIEMMDETTEEERKRKVTLQDSVRAITEEMRAREELDKALNKARKQVSEDYQDVLYGRDGKGTEIKPERGTWQGMIYERAPAVGLAITGAVAMAVGSLYQQGEQANKAMRDDIISIGQRTGQEGWRKGIRNTAQDAGLNDYLGFTGQEMLKFQDTYLSRRGFNGTDDLESAMVAQAEFSRATGLSADTTKNFFDGILGSAKLTGTDIGLIQDGFIGAIKQSGMEGREEEQLDALRELVGMVGDGRTIGQGEIANLMGLQSILSASDSEGLKGAMGGRLMNDLNQGIQDGFRDPKARLLFGQGTQYQGLEGRWELRQQMGKGISDVENVRTIARVASGYGSGNEAVANEAFATIVQDTFGTDITAEQAEGLMDMYREGQLSEEGVRRAIEEGTRIGANESENRLDTYRGEKEALANQSEATTEKQSSRFNDFGDIVKKANVAVGRMPAPIYAAIVAISALGVAASGTAASFLLSERVRGLASNRMGRGRSPITDKNGNPINSKGGGGGGLGTMLFGGGEGKGRGKGGADGKGGKGPILGPDGKPMDSSKDTKRTPRKGRFGKMLDLGEKGLGKAGKFIGIGGILGSRGAGKGGGLFGGGKGKGLGKWLGGAGKIANKAFLPLALGLGALDIFSAPEGHKGEAVGSTVGGLGGALGGAKVGTALGTVVPGLGNVVGGVAGGIVGGLLGAFGGGKVGGSVDDYKSSRKEAPRLTPNTYTEGISDNQEMSARGLGSSFMSMSVLGLVSKLFGSKQLGETPKRSDNVGQSQGEDAMHSVKDHVDRETASRKDHAETKRGDNISEERLNLDRMEAALKEADRLLMQARMQNGIMGNNGGVGGTGLGGYPGGKLRFLPEGQKWDNPNDLTRSDLRSTDAKLTAADLDAWIDAKAPQGSVMRGMGEAFFQAGQESGLDPRYLIAHAAEETGWGTSNIVKKKNNWFGIGAFDHDPMNKAFTFGDGDRGQGIIEGAKWIAKNYYDNGETNLREMNKRYATNPAWASNIANIMKGAPSGTGTINVDAKVTVNATGGDLSRVSDSPEIARMGREINDKIWNSLSFQSKEMRRG